MRAVIVDDEYLAINRLEKMLGNYKEVRIDGTFEDSGEAMAYIRDHGTEVIFLDMDMPVFDGLTMARKVRAFDDKVKIIFVTAYSTYALEAFDVYAFDYLVKPIPVERLAKTMSRLYREMALDKREQLALRVNAFGGFDMEVCKNGQVSKMKWRTSKMKELAAYLTAHLNEEVQRDTIIELFWKDLPVRNGYNNLNSVLHYLRKEMKSHEIGHMLRSDKKTVSFYDEGNQVRMDIGLFKDWSEQAMSNNVINDMLATYKGAYLQGLDYSWAEGKRRLYEDQIFMAIEQWIQKNSLDDINQLMLTAVIELIQYNEDRLYKIIRLLKRKGDMYLSSQYYSRIVLVSKEDGTEPRFAYEEL